MSELTRYAFISYNHKDAKMAQWIHRNLESYKLPSEIHNEYVQSKYLRPVFRDKDDLNSGVLSEELRKNLESAKYLIVICSPNSAKSEWVSDEVKAFIEMGRINNIIPFIIDGTPHNYSNENPDEPKVDECFPRYLRTFTKEHPELELLGISIAEVGRKKAFVRLVSRMLEINFDVLWNRYKRARKRKIIGLSISIPIAILCAYFFAIPVKIQAVLHDEGYNLPHPDNAKIVVGNAEYRMDNLDTTLILKQLPGYYKGRKIDLVFDATYYQQQTVSQRLKWGTSNSIQINLRRDSTFAYYAGHVMDEDCRPLSGVEVLIEGSTSTTDSQGFFSIQFDVQRQSLVKKVVIRKAGYSELVLNEESPNKELAYILHKI